MAQSLAAVGQRTPLLVRPDGESLRIIKGNRRLLAARLLGWLELAVWSINGEHGELAALAVALVEGSLTLAERAQAIYELRSLYPMRTLSAELGYSPPFLYNLARLRADLIPVAWAQLEAEGARASAERWIEVAGKSPELQRQWLQKKDKKPPPRIKDRRILEKKRRSLRPKDRSYQILSWVLNEGDWPE